MLLPFLLNQVRTLISEKTPGLLGQSQRVWVCLSMFEYVWVFAFWISGLFRVSDSNRDMEDLFLRCSLRQLHVHACDIDDRCRWLKFSLGVDIADLIQLQQAKLLLVASMAGHERFPRQHQVLNLWMRLQCSKPHNPSSAIWPEMGCTKNPKWRFFLLGLRLYNCWSMAGLDSIHSGWRVQPQVSASGGQLLCCLTALRVLFLLTLCIVRILLKKTYLPPLLDSS